jgi:hypothetical protein
VRVRRIHELGWYPHTGLGYTFGDDCALSFADEGGAVPIIPVASTPDGSGMDDLPVAMSATRL